jgi:ubiquinone/menaquinone biosynthesis C-methylase UbiE
MIDINKEPEKMSENQKARSPAQVYDEFFVPALFHPWARVVADAADVEPGQRVLDVACGTGVLACTLAERVGLGGSVVGLDPSEEMLEVARTKSDAIEWRTGRAESIPFPDESFDAVVSQFGIMFFDDPGGALREMMRVMRPGGRLAVAVCDALENSPGYAAFEGLLRRLFGDRVAGAFRSPFVLGDTQKLFSLCADAGIFHARVTRHDGTVRFASIQSLVSTERACVWTLGGLLDDEQFEELSKESERALQSFVGIDGTLAFTMPALIVTAAKARAELEKV